MFLKIVITLLCITSVFCDIIHIRQHVKSTRPTFVHKVHTKHHKRGAYSLIPPFKAGYDIPVVSHSFIKPIVVHYPTKAVPIGVKIPLRPPPEDQHPHHVGHNIPSPHPGPSIKIPGWSKPLVIPLPTKVQHVFKPIIPVAPVVPTVSVAPSIQVPVPLPPPPAPTVPVNTFVPAPAVLNFRPGVPQQQFFFQSAPLVPSHPPSTFVPMQQPAPLIPAHVHPAPVPIAPQPAVFPAVIRPGNAIQQSLFATYPRHPFIPQHLIHLVQPQLRPLLIGRPAAVAPPQFLLPQPQQPAAIVPEHQHPHLVPGESGFAPGIVQPEHPPYPPADAHTYSQEQHIPVFENNGEGADFHAHYQQPQPNYEQQQYEHDQHQQFLEQQHHQLHQQQFEQEQNQLHQQQYDQQFHQHQQQQSYDQQHHQQFEHQFNEQQNHQFDQQQNHLFNQQFHQQQIDEAQFNPQIHQEYGPPSQQYGVPPDQQYGLPQHQERSDQNQESSSEDNEQTEQKYHNHIPLKQQPPLEKELDKF